MPATAPAEFMDFEKIPIMIVGNSDAAARPNAMATTCAAKPGGFRPSSVAIRMATAIETRAASISPFSEMFGLSTDLIRSCDTADEIASNRPAAVDRAAARPPAAISAIEQGYDESVVLAGQIAIRTAPYARARALGVEPSTTLIGEQAAMSRTGLVLRDVALVSAMGEDAYREVYRPLVARRELSLQRLALVLELPRDALSTASLRLARAGSVEVSSMLGVSSAQVRAYLTDLEALVERDGRGGNGLY